jgi:hypothetical protein
MIKQHVPMVIPLPGLNGTPGLSSVDLPTLSLPVFPVLYLCLLPSSTHFTQKKEVAGFSKTLASYQITTQHQNPDDHDLNLHCHENLKSHISKIVSREMSKYASQTCHNRQIFLHLTVQIVH